MGLILSVFLSSAVIHSKNSNPFDVTSEQALDQSLQKNLLLTINNEGTSPQRLVDQSDTNNGDIQEALRLAVASFEQASETEARETPREADGREGDVQVGIQEIQARLEGPGGEKRRLEEEGES